MRVLGCALGRPGCIERALEGFWRGPGRALWGSLGEFWDGLGRLGREFRKLVARKAFLIFIIEE